MVGTFPLTWKLECMFIVFHGHAVHGVVTRDQFKEHAVCRLGHRKSKHGLTAAEICGSNHACICKSIYVLA